MYIYEFYVSGWVQTAYYHMLRPGFTSCLLKAKVKHSQSLLDKAYEPWVAAEKKALTC